MYIPPGHSEAQKRNRKQKHMVQFRGPLRVSKQLSTNTFELESVHDPSRKYRRHFSSLRRWKGSVPVTDNPLLSPPPVPSGDLSVGEFVFVLSDSKSTEFYLARVHEIREDIIVVACYGSGSKNQATATFKPIFVLPDKSVSIGKPRGRTRATNYTWDIPILAIDTLVLACSLVLLPSGKLSKDTRALVHDLSPRVLHRFV